MKARPTVKLVTWAVVACLSLAALCWLLSREPSYHGKSLSGWLENFGHGESKYREAELAIRAIGNRALPHLLKMIGSKESALKRRLVEIASKQTLVDLHFRGWVHAGQGRVLPRKRPLLTIELTSAEEKRDRAAMGIRALGSEAKSAIPRLAGLLSDPETSPPAINALAGIGPETLPVLTPLTRSSDAEIRALVNKAFSEFAVGAEAKAYAPQLTPLLLENLRDDYYLIRAGAAGALVEVADPAVAVPALMPNLQHTNAYVRAMTGQALGCLGSKSTAAVPTLLELTKDEDAFVRDRVIWALRRIDPQAVENNRPKDNR